MATRLSKKAIILIVAVAFILSLGLLAVPDSPAEVDALAPVYQLIHYLDDLVDVNASSPADNEVLTWDAATGMWIPETVGGGGFTCTDLNSCSLNNIGDVDIPTPVYGYVIYWNGTAWKAKAEDTFTCSDLAGCTFTMGQLATEAKLVSITFIIDGCTSELTTGEKGHLEVPFNCTIQRVTMAADQTGSIVVDIWKDTYANFPPTNADSITASAPPTISSAQKSQDSTLTDWTTTINEGDILAYNVDSCTNITRVTVSLKAEKT